MDYLKYFKQKYKLIFLCDDGYTSINRDNFYVCSIRVINYDYNKMKYNMAPFILSQMIP